MLSPQDDTTRQPPIAFTIREFCNAHKISTAFYYDLRNSGRGPREMILGTRRVISAEAAADWRREREATVTT
jgi:hypothetical protein